MTEGTDGAGRDGHPAQAARARRSPRARTGRRAGDSGSREAILDSARLRFAEHGYEGATIRGIAAGAGVDPALVHHFYGTKEKLFAAAMRLPAVPSEVIASALASPPGVRPGPYLVATVLAIWEDPAVHGVMIGLLRSAMNSEQAARLLREFISDAILAPVSALARPGPAEDAAYRAAAVASQMLGLALTRYVLRVGPIATASIADLAATIGPTVERYLTGDIRAGDDSPP
ncbi:MAG TPA: TetR family transcriptional regulator [Streptosporangiaceae bacterium]|nr:TetR family transcriptional regulator [Streptosporangiaceae bacterium]